MPQNNIHGISTTILLQAQYTLYIVRHLFKMKPTIKIERECILLLQEI